MMAFVPTHSVFGPNDFEYFGGPHKLHMVSTTGMQGLGGSISKAPALDQRSRTMGRNIAAGPCKVCQFGNMGPHWFGVSFAKCTMSQIPD